MGIGTGLWQIYLWACPNPNETVEAIVMGCDSVQCIREKTGVRGLLDTEIDLRDGTFGFTPPWSIKVDQDSYSATSSRVGTSQVELHKTQAGKVIVVVYLQESSAARLTDRRNGRKEVDARFAKGDGYDVVVGLPLSRIASWRHGSTNTGARFAIVGVI